jgi:hypothetical protein
VALQPSPSFVLPSSQLSDEASCPSPQGVVLGSLASLASVPPSVLSWPPAPLELDPVDAPPPAPVGSLPLVAHAGRAAIDRSQAIANHALFTGVYLR